MVISRSRCHITRVLHSNALQHVQIERSSEESVDLGGKLLVLHTYVKEPALLSKLAVPIELIELEQIFQLQK